MNTISPLNLLNRTDADKRASERGSTLLLAMFLMLILTMLGMGLLSRTLVVSKIASAERWSTKAFYAADSGLHTALQRARINEEEAFTFFVQDLRGAGGTRSHQEISVDVDRLSQVMDPQPAKGSQISGGQGGSGTNLVVYFYKGRSTSTLSLSRSRRTVSNMFSIGPMPLKMTNIDL
ncbi:MAG: hypothetical protein GY906_33900 [bacterium]|nr:hypothetical protein [bacterium]